MKRRAIGIYQSAPYYIKMKVINVALVHSQLKFKIILNGLEDERN